MGCFFVLKKHIDPTGAVRLGVQKSPPGVGVWGKQPETGDLRFEIGKFFLFQLPIQRIPWDEVGCIFTYIFMVDFGWFSWLGKFIPDRSAASPWILSFRVRFDEQIPFSFGPPTRPQLITSKCFSFIPLEVGLKRVFRFFLVPKIGS